MSDELKSRSGTCKVCEFEFQEYYSEADYYDYANKTPKDQCRSCYSERVDERIDRR